MAGKETIAILKVNQSSFRIILKLIKRCSFTFLQKKSGSDAIQLAEMRAFA
jgi:hypothetical protein